MSLLPRSLPVLERVFPRTFLALRPRETARLAADLARANRLDDLAHFPEALAARKWEPNRGFAPDLARLELALRLAGLAPEEPGRGFERVPLAREPDWYGARFRFDPGLRLLESEWPLAEAHAHPTDGHARSPGTFLVYRAPGGRAAFRAVGENEDALLRSLSLGVPLGRVLERNHGPDLDARTFQRWMDTGVLRAIDWASV